MKLPPKEKGKWIMLNQDGKMTTPLNIAKTTESSVSVFIIPVHQTYLTYL